MDRHLPSQRGKNIITNIAAILFLLIASFHFIRAVYGWEATIAGWHVPLWVSWVAVAIALYLALLLYSMDKVN